MRALMKQEIRYKFAEMLVLRSPEVPSSSSQRRDRLTAHTCAPLSDEEAPYPFGIVAPHSEGIG